MTAVVVAATGSEYRRDDGAALAAARLVASGWASRHAGDEPGLDFEVVFFHDPLDLLGRWDGADLAVVLDATRSGSPAGAVCSLRLDGAGDTVDRTPAARGSTHGIDLIEVLRIARTVGCAPRDVVLVGIEGADFGLGEGLTPTVVHGAEAAAELVIGLLEGACRCA